MILTHLSLLNFKNITDCQIDLHPKCNCLYGSNGMGKTNVLDAIYYLSYSKSFFNAVDAEHIMWGSDFFLIQGRYQRQDLQDEVSVAVKQNKKKVVKRNDKEYRKISEHIGLYPLVMISPADTELIEGGSDARRKFIDGIISQFSATYLDHLLQYNKALSQRNKLLKQMAESRQYDQTLLETYDWQLIKHGGEIHKARTLFLEEFKSYFQSAYETISSSAEVVSLKYDSKLNDTDFEHLLKASAKKDFQLRYTSVGIHKDDLDLQIAGYGIKKFGSQGQKKSYVTALKFAQYHFMQQKVGFKPLLMLDDIFDKLDEHRVAAIIKLIHEDAYGQIFITDTEPDRLKKAFGGREEAYFYHVQQGAFTKTA